MLRHFNISFARKLRENRIASPVLRLACSRQYGNHPAKVAAIDAGNSMEVQHPRWPHSLSLSYPWLRDHCQCHQCFNHTTAQRRFDVTKMQLNIRPAAITATPEEVAVQWPDGHKSTYKYQFLWQNTYEGCRTSHKVPQLPWTSRTFPAPDLTTVPLSELTHPQKAGARRLVAAIVKHGFAFISEVPVDVEATRSAIKIICPIKKTFFGEMYTMEGTGYDHYDTAYSTEFIGAHTDCTYFSQAARIQVFHCLKPAEEGGENLLVDGFSVAEQFRTKHPEGYSFLSSEAIPSVYMEDGQHHVSLDTVFKHNPVTQRLRQIRYNIYDRAPLSSIPLEKMQHFYSHLVNLTKIIQNPKNECWFKQEPGTVLLIDNWRLLHGRQGFRGRRVMSGCYLDNEEFTNSARLLGVQLE